MKSIFITGATGYLGSLITKELINSNHTLFCLKRKKSNFVRVNDIKENISWVDIEHINFDDFFSKNKIDVILHCATNYGRGIFDPSEIIDSNLILPLRILHSAAANNVKTFINTDTFLDKRVNNYSLSKKHFSEWLQSYSAHINAIDVILEHFYGPGDDPTKFVTDMIIRLLKNVDKIDLTPGEQKRDFIYIDDVVNAFKIIIDNTENFKKGYSRFEVGSSNSISIRDFLIKIKNKLPQNNTYLNFGAIHYRSNEIMDSYIDICELKKLGWKPLKSLDEGLDLTIKYEVKKLS
jgi:nucleoside-diphosphate-sugar epimerase